MHLYQIRPRKNSSLLRRLFWQLRMYKTSVCIVILIIFIYGIYHIYSDDEKPYSMERKSKFTFGLGGKKKFNYDRDMPLIFIGGVPRLVELEKNIM